MATIIAPRVLDPGDPSQDRPRVVSSWTYRADIFWHPTNTRMGVLSGNQKGTGTFTVGNNNFSTGSTVIEIGDFALVSRLHYQPGANVNATAANIVTALNKLDYIDASANNATVTFTVDIDVDFKIIHYGTIANFTNINPVGRIRGGLIQAPQFGG